MNTEWLNRIALTYANKTRLRTIRQALDNYGSATEIINRHPELVNHEALTFAQQELLFIEKHHIKTYFYQDENYPYRLAQCIDATLLIDHILACMIKAPVALFVFFEKIQINCFGKFGVMRKIESCIFLFLAFGEREQLFNKIA
mgnify:CR=1 FL=1